MTGPVVAPVIPSAMSGGRAGMVTARARGPLPVARLQPVRDRVCVYGFSTLDSRGRVADLAVIRALGWSAGTRLDIREQGGLILVTGRGHGVFTVSGDRHLHLPATVRRWCGLHAGDRVLLAADPQSGVLVVHPPAVLDTIVGRLHHEVLGGGAG